MALKIKRGNGAPSETLENGEIYFDYENNRFYVGDGSNNIEYLPAWKESDITTAEGTIPAISSDSRQVVQITLGELLNSTKALIGFYNSNTSDGEYNFSSSVEALGHAVTNWYNTSIITYNNYIPTVNNLLVYEDYTLARRFVVGNTQESYGSVQEGAALPRGTTYSDIGVGVLVGWYGLTSNDGFLTVDKKVELESAWLTQDGDDTVLNLALYNRDDSPNTSKDFKVAVYE